MACNYAQNLSPYDNKGVLGTPECFEDEESVNKKSEEVAKLLIKSGLVVVHTGAGISTNAGIPDFRGPNGVWTLEEKGIKPDVNTSFLDAIPTVTHMALKTLIDKGYIHYIVSQNIDGLHMKCGLHRKYISELHGNMFIDECNMCHRQYIRESTTPTIGRKLTGGVCKIKKSSRPCRGKLMDNVLDWDHELPKKDLFLAQAYSRLADLNFVLGTTLQINPAGNLPFENKKYGGRTVICNLQPTKHDEKSDIKISADVDSVMVKLLKHLNLELLQYKKTHDRTKNGDVDRDWTIAVDEIKTVNRLYKQKYK